MAMLRWAFWISVFLALLALVSLLPEIRKFERVFYVIPTAVLLFLTLFGISNFSDIPWKKYLDKFLQLLERKEKISILALSFFIAVILIPYDFLVIDCLYKRYVFNKAIENAARNREFSENLARAFEIFPQRPEPMFLFLRRVHLLRAADERATLSSFVANFSNQLQEQRFIDTEILQKNLVCLCIDEIQHVDPIFWMATITPLSGGFWNAALTKEAITIAQSRAEFVDDAQLFVRFMKLEKLDIELNPELGQAGVRVTNISEEARAKLDERRELRDKLANLIRDPEFLEDNQISHFFQESADHIAQYHLDTCKIEPDPAAQATHLDEAIKYYILVLNTRRSIVPTLSATGFIWFREPDKLSIFHIFRYFDGERFDRAGTKKWVEENLSEDCPNAKGRIKLELYDIFSFFHKNAEGFEAWKRGTIVDDNLTTTGSDAMPSLSKGWRW